jgi:uncharacterized protein (DUF983 family)
MSCVSGKNKGMVNLGSQADDLDEIKISSKEIVNGKMDVKNTRINPVKKARDRTKTSKLHSILNLNCPRCHQGKLFSNKNPYTFKDGLNMPDNCPVCHQDFKIEPGFYIGALWVSFPIVIVLMAMFSLLFLAYFKMQLEWFFAAITLILLILQPLIIRTGRAIWIHIFVAFKEASEN